jgi:chemotaxis protein histidine kinase CheA
MGRYDLHDDALDEEDIEFLREERRIYLSERLCRRVEELTVVVAELKRNPGQPEKIKETARQIHSLLGSAKLYELRHLDAALTPLEDVLRPYFFQPRPFSRPFLEYLNEVSGILHEWSREVQRSADEIELYLERPPKP